MSSSKWHTAQYLQGAVLSPVGEDVALCVRQGGQPGQGGSIQLDPLSLQILGSINLYGRRERTKRSNTAMSVRGFAVAFHTQHVTTKEEEVRCHCLLINDTHVEINL